MANVSLAKVKSLPRIFYNCIVKSFVNLLFIRIPINWSLLEVEEKGGVWREERMKRIYMDESQRDFAPHTVYIDEERENEEERRRTNFASA